MAEIGHDGCCVGYCEVAGMIEGLPYEVQICEVDTVGETSLG